MDASDNLNSSSSSSSLSPGAAIRLLWAAAVLEEPAGSIQPLLLATLAGISPTTLSQHELRLLYQTHRLTQQQDWVSGDKAAQAARVRTYAAHEPQQQQWEKVGRLVSAGKKAAAAYAAASAARNKQQVQAVQRAFEELGFSAPVQGIRVDGGALQPDLAFIAGSSDGSSGSNDGSSGSSSSVKVALMCDHAGRYSRNAPYELLGYWRVYGWLLEADGWRVVRFPAHEWRLLMQDRGAHGGSTMAYVYNTLLAQGIVL
jgi:hypothetical protein